MVHQTLIALLAVLAGVAQLALAAEMIDLGKYGVIEADTKGMKKMCALEFDLGNDYYNHMIEDDSSELWKDIEMISRIRVSNSFPCSSYVAKFFGPPKSAYEWRSIYTVFSKKCDLETTAKVYCEESGEALESLKDAEKAARYKKVMCDYYEKKMAARKSLGESHKIRACRTDVNWQTRHDAREKLKEEGVEKFVAYILEDYPENEPQPTAEESARVATELAKLRMDTIESRMKQMTLRARLMDRLSFPGYFSTPMQAPDHVCDQLEDEISIKRCKEQIKKYWRYDPN